jgi:hypothetical protein
MFRTAMSLDRTHRKLTALVAALLVVSLTVVLVTRAQLGIGVLAILGAVLALAWAMSPRELVVDGGELRIERRAWRPLRVPLSSVVSAAPLSRLGGRTLRLFGVGGFFGSYGLFSNQELGRFRLYATRGGQAVIVRRGGDQLPIVVTPDDVAGTIEAIDRRPMLTA